MTQQEVVLNHLKKHNGITSMEAFNLYGITRLSDVIYKLKYRQGINIISESLKVKTRYGTNAYVAKYSLDHPDKKKKRKK